MNERFILEPRMNAYKNSTWLVAFDKVKEEYVKANVASKQYAKFHNSVTANDFLEKYEGIEYIIQERKNEPVFYVLRYDLKTTEYNNELVFKTFENALKEYKKTKPNYDDEVIELVFAPTDNDEIFGENEIIARKFK